MVEIGATAELLDSGVQSAEDSMNKQIQYLLGHPETDAVICLGQLGTEVAPKAIEEAGMSIPSGGFDLSEKILNNIIDGDMLGTVDQQPYFQGSLSVYFLWANNKYALTPCNVNTGTLQLIDMQTAPKILPLTKTHR
jgi:ABC-type sugar transport system substrate-binding protein